jgi:hypothetical protein
MGKNVSARIKNRIKMHFVRAIRMLEKKIGKEPKFQSKSERRPSRKSE